MTIRDILGQVTDQGNVNPLTVPQICLSLLFAFLLGLVIAAVYKMTYKGVMYSKTFNLTLIVLSLVTSVITLAITSNIVVALGMVGALSIIRFRAAIKDPMDIVYMFWAISAGIIAGVGVIALGFIMVIFIALVIIVASKLSFGSEPYLLVISYVNDGAENYILNAVNKKSKSYKLKTKTKDAKKYEMTLELRSVKDIGSLVNYISGLSGVMNVAIINYDGNFAA